MSEVNRILVLRGGALGDFILTVPALRVLRERWPSATLELSGNATAARLGQVDGLLDRVHSQHEARWASLYGEGALSPEFHDWLAGFDLICSFWPDPERDLEKRFPLRPGQRFIGAAAKPSLSPAGRHFCEALRPLGLERKDYRATLELAGLRLPKAKPLRVALHPGSSSPRRNWPAERWAEVLRRLRTAGLQTLLIAGEADQEPLRCLGSEADSVLIQAPLEKLASELSSCGFYLGHDTGVSHLAAALSVPCLLLFGPSEPALWAPQGPHVLALKRGDKMEALSVEDVWSSLQMQFASELRA